MMLSYRFFRRRLPHWLALLLTVLMLLILVGLSLYYGSEPQAEFRYRDI